ncbi:hypothetical protein GCM10011506_38210 [Marivirga lumbricoides]|uniref:Uncharacterized protein n=1 Tax=Marivirga lumbricoides TaxID=1046115 RepID=A0ABQ1MXF6_9BACT|nr:hypothetical protein GCM10011506_38210 [Marivirga lumbricoides]
MLIEKRSQITISLTTIRRIWKPDYAGTPQPGTLDALAKFLEYEGWLEFTEKHQKAGIKVSSSNKLQRKNWKVITYATISIASVICIILGINAVATTSNQSSSNASLSVKYASPINVPNTVIFNYNLNGIQADSFFIQQSWNKFRRERVSKSDTILTSTYYYPGAHQASLIANDKVIAQAKVLIKTDEWIALARADMSDENPTYIDVESHKPEGIFTVTEKQLQKYNLSLDPNLLLCYYYVNSFKGLDKDNFRLKVRVKSDSVMSLACPKISIMILGTEDMHMIPLTFPGCIGSVNLKIADKLFKGKHTDLSSFGASVYNWNLVEITLINGEYKILLNGQEVYSIHTEQSIGEVIGLNINFTGSGSMGFVELSNSKTNKTVYFEDFKEDKRAPQL